MSLAPHERFEFIVKEIIDRGLLKNQTAVAAAIGMDQSDLSKCLKGKAVPPLRALEFLAKQDYSVTWYFVGGPMEDRFVRPNDQLRALRTSQWEAWEAVKRAGMALMDSANQHLSEYTEHPESDTSNNQLQP